MPVLLAMERYPDCVGHKGLTIDWFSCNEDCPHVGECPVWIFSMREHFLMGLVFITEPAMRYMPSTDLDTSSAENWIHAGNGTDISRFNYFKHRLWILKTRIKTRIKSFLRKK